MLDLPIIQSQNTRGSASADAKARDGTSVDPMETDFETEYQEADAADEPSVVDSTGDAETGEDEAAISDPTRAEVAAAESGELITATSTTPIGNDAEPEDFLKFAVADPSRTAKIHPQEGGGVTVENDRQSTDITKPPQERPKEISGTQTARGEPTRTPDDAVVSGMTTRPMAKRSTAETVIMTRALQAAPAASNEAPKEIPQSVAGIGPAAAPDHRAASDLARPAIPRGANRSDVAHIAMQMPVRVKENRDSYGAERRLEVAELPTPRRGAVFTAQPPSNGMPHIAQSKLVAVQNPSEFVEVVLNDQEIAASFEQRTSQQVTSAQMQQVLQRAETPAMIARQMAEALQKMPDRPVEISLNPKELGRVRMNISAVEAGITVSVIAERPETLDLMRRNIDQLAREFELIGYSDINFAFSQGETQQDFSDQREETSHTPASHLDLERIDERTATQGALMPTGGVDIRV